MRKILVTGASGFIGKNLCEFYKADNEVLEVGKSTLLMNCLNSFKPDIVFHCAAEIYKEPLMVHSNILYSQCVLDYCANSKIEKLIIFGSSSEYGYKTRPMSEEDLLEPRTIYEATKGAATLLAQAYSKIYSIPTVVIRPFTIVGRHEKTHKFFPTLYKKWKMDEELTLGEGFHDFVFIDDFVRMVNDITFKNLKTFDIVNVGSGFSTSNSEIVEIFESLTGYEYKIKKVDKLRSFDSNFWVANTEKAKRVYGTDVFNGRNLTNREYLECGIRKFIEDCENLKLYV